MADLQSDMTSAPDVPDVELLKTQEEPIRARRKRDLGVWVLAAGALAASALAAYVLFVRRPTEALVTTAPAATAPAPVTAAPAVPPGGGGTAIDLPPLAQSDALVRTLVTAISSHPRIAAWLASDGLLRNFTVVVANIAEGRTPARHLQVLALSSPFRVVNRGGVLSVDPRNYRRYDSLTAAVASVEPAAAARLYATLEPRIEDAYREIGDRDTSFDQVLERAIVLLLDTPAPSATPRLGLGPKGISYVLADQRLEALSAPQKQLLRMGPENAKTMQAALRAIAQALGIPPDRLPAP
jgi:hypothetical protein